MLSLYLVRHGVTVWNDQGRFQGHTDVPLSDLGIRQAELVAERLSDRPLSAVWSSDLSRASRTAEEIARRHGLPVVTRPGLRETDGGTWEGLTHAEIVARGEGHLLEASRRDPLANRPPEGERLEAVAERLLAVLREIRDMHAEGSVVAVGHGGSLRVLLCDALAAPLRSLQHMWLDNASVSLIEIDTHRTRVRLMNDTSHLAALAAPAAPVSASGSPAVPSDTPDKPLPYV